MDVLVPEKLAELEARHGVRVLLAVESGSRAWGFASPDSDFDVRFIYVHDRDWYLRLQRPRDVIEEPIDDTWDVSGWDLDKSLRQLYKCNPTLYEWLQGPIVYRDDGFSARVRPLAEAYFSPRTCCTTTSTPPGTTSKPSCAGSVCGRRSTSTPSGPYWPAAG